MDNTSEGRGATIGGHVLANFAFDIGFQIDLDEAARLAGDATRHRVVRARRPAPVWFDYSPPPVRLIVEGEAVSIGGVSTGVQTEMLIYDFGAALLTYRLALPDTLEGTAALSVALQDHADLEENARERVRRVMEAIRASIERPKLGEAVEDYVIFAVTSWDERLPPAAMVEANRGMLARIIEAERGELSDEQTIRATDAAMSYSPADMAIVDWNAAILFDAEPDDVIAVLQHANIELLELRVLDQELDLILDHADETLGEMSERRLWPSFVSGRTLRHFGSVQTDAAVMFEGVNNAIKLLGNQYLARLYRLGAGRLDLPAWQSSVQRKLTAAESLYQKLSDATAVRRLETLEWVIIILIALSMALPFMPWYH